MKKNIRKTAAILLTLCLIFLCGFPAFCAEEGNCYDYLLSCGYEEEFLDEISDSAAEKIFALIGENEVTNVEKRTEKRIKKSGKDEVEVTTVIANLKEKDSDYFSGQVVCAFWRWLDKKPILRKESLVSSNWNNAVLTFDAGTVWFEDYSRNSAGEKWNVENTGENLSIARQNEIGKWTKTEWFKNQVGGVMIFRLIPAEPLKAEKADLPVVLINFTHDSFPEAAVLILVLVLAVAAVTFVLIVIKRRHKKSVTATYDEQISKKLP